MADSSSTGSDFWDRSIRPDFKKAAGKGGETGGETGTGKQAEDPPKHDFDPPGPVFKAPGI
jgi:hypothetical protein